MKSINLLVTLSLVVGSFAAQALEFSKDVPKDIQQQMTADLTFIGQITGQGSTKLHRDIFGEVSGQGYNQFFTSRIVYVGMDSCGNPNAVACVSPMRGSDKMFLTNNFIKFSHPQIARMMVVFHESRHSEVKNGNWPHDDCPSPYVDENGKDIVSIWTGAKVAGMPACDSTPFGSYGSSTIMLKNIAKFCTNCSDKVKMDANIYADDQLNRIDVPSVKQQMKNDFAAN